jgi:hypothetical protein
MRVIFLNPLVSSLVRKRGCPQARNTHAIGLGAFELAALAGQNSPYAKSLTRFQQRQGKNTLGALDHELLSGYRPMLGPSLGYGVHVDFLANDFECGTGLNQTAGDPFVFVEQSEQQTLRLNRWGAKVTGLVTGEADRST